MTLDELIELTAARLGTLGVQRTQAWQQGDAASVQRLDAEIAQTQDTLRRLREA